jgi:hypothetical protein
LVEGVVTASPFVTGPAPARDGQNDGTSFQDKFRKAVEALAVTERVYFHRFTDTKAARNFVKAQPGDCMVVADGMAHLFELKSTDVGTTLTKFLSSKEGKHEAAEARKWERAGGKAWFVREDTRKGEVEFYQAGAWLRGVKAPYRTCKVEGLLGELKLLIT